MLTQLRINHFAIIDALEARFERGFNVVTGETGTGKSILIDALHLLLGGRAQSDLVRTGHDECSVDGLVEPLDLPATNARLEAAGLPLCEDGQLILRRTVHREGRSKAWLNGAPATMGQLSSVVRGLVDISGQHEHTSLMDSEQHVGLVDLYAGLGPLLERYTQAWKKLSEAAAKLRSLQMNESQRMQRVDFLRFQVDEIGKLDPKPGEDEELKAERQKLASAGKLRDVTSDVEQLLYSRDGAVVEVASKAAGRIAKAAELDPALSPIADVLEAAAAQFEEAARDLGRYARQIDDDPRRLEAIDDRLDGIKKLARKHGGDVASIIARRDEMAAELSKLESHEKSTADAEAERKQALSAACALAAELTTERKKAGEKFAQAVVGRLASLEMAKTVFVVQVSPLGDAAEDALEGNGVRLNAKGQDQLEFLISPNPGEAPKPLQKVASGGELSRVMLAIKRVLAERDPVETYVFDEVDAGIGGATGETVGRMIREVSRERQVLCITHLPQIAAWADAHYVVEKGVQNGRTHSSLTRLTDDDGRRREVARMLSGHLTDASLQHAAELLHREEPAKPAKKRGAS